MTPTEIIDDMLLPEPLHPTLEAYRGTMGHGLEAIQHPLVYAVPYMPAMNRLHNQQLRQKQEGIIKAMDGQKITSYVWLHERPHRLQAFLDYLDQWPETSDRVYWETLRDIWIDSENIWQNAEEWRDLLTAKRSGRRAYLMDHAERKKLAELPESVTIYRGATKGVNEDGLSWTLDRAKALWFSKRFQTEDRKPILLRRKIAKRDILAYITGRNEEEIIVRPGAQLTMAR